MSEIKNLEFLPYRNNCRENNWKDKIKEKIDANNLNCCEQQILNLILNKENWSLKQYKTFRGSLVRVNSKNRKFIKESILKTLTIDDEEIKRNLIRFSSIEKQNYYPFKDRQKDKNTGKYYYIEKKIETSDVFYLISEITKKIDSFFASLTNTILEELNNNIYVLLDLVIEMIDNKESSLHLKIIEKYEEEFKYLEDIDVFNDIYNNYKRNIGTVILHFISTNKARRFQIEPYEYIKEKRLAKN